MYIVDIIELVDELFKAKKKSNVEGGIFYA